MFSIKLPQSMFAACQRFDCILFQVLSKFEKWRKRNVFETISFFEKGWSAISGVANQFLFVRFSEIDFSSRPILYPTRTILCYSPISIMFLNAGPKYPFIAIKGLQIKVVIGEKTRSFHLIGRERHLSVNLKTHLGTSIIWLYLGRQLNCVTIPEKNDINNY